MDWRLGKFDWNHARAFLVVVNEGSFSAAARALGTSQPTISRQVSALEKELNLVFLERGKSGLKLTPAGSELVALIEQMGNAAFQVSLSATGKSQTLEGQVFLSASQMDAAFLLPEPLHDLNSRHPGVTVRLIAADSLSDLARRDADIGLRGSKPQEGDMRAKSVGRLSAGLFASRAYIERNGLPGKSQAWADANFLASDTMTVVQKLFKDSGIDIGPQKYGVDCSDRLVQLYHAVAGSGLGLFPTYINSYEPELVKIETPFEDMVYDLWLVTPRDLYRGRRIRAAYDMLHDALTLKLAST